MDSKEAKEVAAWAKAESLKLQETWPRGNPRERELIAHWRVHRPQMVKSLVAETRAQR